MRTASSVRSTTGAVYATPNLRAKPKAPTPHPGHPHTTPKPKPCHCSPNPYHPCTHTPRTVAKKHAAAVKAQATKVAKAAAMTVGQKKVAATARHASAVKAAATRAAHKKTANPHRPAAKKPAKKAC